MEQVGKKLGKLSLAILENFVEDKLGKKFVEELRSPTDRALAIEAALEQVEERFKKEFPDKDLARAIFVDLSVDKATLGKTIGKFFDHPTDSDFPQSLAMILTSEFKKLSPERINAAVSFYIKLLKQEFALADETFREKIRILTDLDTLDYLKKLGEEHYPTKFIEQSANIQLILDGEFSKFNKEKQEDVIGVLSALLHVEKNSIRILRVSPGSIVLEIELNLAAANRLLKLFESKDFRLKSIGVISVKILEANKKGSKKKVRKTAKPNAYPTKAGSVNITIQGSVIGSNLIAGSNNQASLNSAFVPSQHPLPTYKPTDEISPAGDLPLGSRLPFAPNPLFTGRLADLKKLASALCSPLPVGEGLGVRSNVGSVITQAVTGMGGLGKTQLAIEFAWRYGKYFRGVHWLNLADPTLFDSEIATCGKDMTFPNFPEDQPTQVTLTLQAWKTNGPRLLILDNFEDPTLVNDILPRLRHSNIRILVTSRRSDWLPTTGLNPIPLDLFSPAESLEFLKRSLLKRKDSDHDLNALAERLGHLPLALELAGRYLNAHPRLSVTEYLAQAKEALEHPSMKAWRKDMLGLTPTQHDTSLLSTFALSWLALNAQAAVLGGGDAAESKELAQLLFQTAGYLAPNTPIPPEIFEKALEISSEQCDDALTLLYGLGLLQQSESPLTNYELRITQPTIHPLLAEYARGLSREIIKILEALADTLGTLADEALETGLPVRFDSIKPHIPVLALYAENEKIESAGALWNNYGYHLDDIADYSAASQAYEHALKNSPDESTYINNLSNVLRAQGDLNGARTTIEHALKIDESAFGPDHPNVAIDINNLSVVLLDLGDLDGARTAIERALKIDEATFGPDHSNVAIEVNNLGMVMQTQGDLAGACAAFERALKIFEANLGKDHPNIAISINNLGMVMKAQGDLVGARAAYERALKIDEAAFGPDHPHIAIVFNNLGSVMQELGDSVTARAAFERALAIFKKFLPPDHPNIKTAQENLDSLGPKS